MKRPWTEAEDAILRREFADSPTRALVTKIERTRTAIDQRASKLGLCKSPEQHARNNIQRRLIERIEIGEIDADRMDALRASVRRGDCPFCGTCGYQNILMHIWMAHGLTAKEARELLGFTFTETVCAPDLTEKMRDARLSEFAVRGAFEFEGYERTSERRFSSAALRVLLDNGRKRRERNGPPVQGVYNLSRKKSPLIHGRALTYKSYGCRCDECRRANTERCKKYRMEKRSTEKPSPSNAAESE